MPEEIISIRFSGTCLALARPVWWIDCVEPCLRERSWIISVCVCVCLFIQSPAHWCGFPKIFCLLNILSTDPYNGTVMVCLYDKLARNGKFTLTLTLTISVTTKGSLVFGFSFVCFCVLKCEMHSSWFASCSEISAELLSTNCSCVWLEWTESYLPTSYNQA